MLTEQRKVEKKTEFIKEYYSCVEKWEDYQIDLFMSTYKNEAILKARQTGVSYGFAADALTTALLFGEQNVIISYARDEAAQKIDYARQFLRSIKKPIILPKVISDSSTSLKFDNGGELISIPASSVRGRSKNVYCDEFEYYRKQREVYRAVTPSTVREDGKKRRLRVFSTPLSSDGMFAGIFRKNDGNRYHLVKIYWWFSSSQCKDVERAKREAPLMNTDERVYEFGTQSLIAEYEDPVRTLDEFKLEYECEFDAMGGDDLIKLDDVMECVNSEYNYQSFTNDNFSFRYNEPVLIGADIGRRNHGTEIMIMSKSNRLLCNISLLETSFSTQKETFRKLMNTLTVEKLRIDGTGLGMNIAEDLKQEFGYVVEAVDFTHKTKESLVSNLKKQVETVSIELPFDKRLIAQLVSLKRQVTDKGTTQYYVKKDSGEKHHADKFFALALAVSSGTNELVGATITTMYKPIERITRRRQGLWG